MNSGATSDGGHPVTVFIHIPRTAGTSFTKSLRYTYGRAAVGRLGNVVKGSGALDTERLERAKWGGRVSSFEILGGHVPLGMLTPRLPPGTRYVTFLRDPVQRTLSHYQNLLRTHEHHYMVAGRSVTELIEEGVYLHSDLQTRMLCDDPDPFGPVTQQMFEQAKANLAGLLGFGLSERFEESLVLLAHRLGVKLAPPRRERRRAEKPRPKASVLRELERLNEYDIELYRWACTHFDGEAAQRSAVAKVPA